MKTNPFSIIAFAISGIWLALSASPASACRECIAGRGSPDRFVGGVIAVGGAASNPYHSTVSIDSGSSLPSYVHSVSPSAFPSIEPQSLYQHQHPADRAIEVGAIGLTRLLTEGNNPGLANLSDIQLPIHELPSSDIAPATLESSVNSPNAGGAVLATNPEPASAALLGLGLLAGLLRRRRS